MNQIDRLRVIIRWHSAILCRSADSVAFLISSTAICRAPPARYSFHRAFPSCVTSSQDVRPRRTPMGSGSYRGRWPTPFFLTEEATMGHNLSKAACGILTVIALAGLPQAVSARGGGGGEGTGCGRWAWADTAAAIMAASLRRASAAVPLRRPKLCQLAVRCYGRSTVRLPMPSYCDIVRSRGRMAMSADRPMATIASIGILRKQLLLRL